MNLAEINTKIKSLTAEINKLTAKHKDDSNRINRAFSFTDSWRDKKSIALRIPIEAKKIKSLSKDLEILKAEKVKAEEVLKQQQLIEAEKAKEAAAKEEELKSIKNPISVIEIE